MTAISLPMGVNAIDYRQCDFTGPTAFLLGAEKWGLSAEATALVDQPLFIPMTGMVQSLNLRMVAAVLLFEALRQRELAGLVPSHGEGCPAGKRNTGASCSSGPTPRWRSGAGARGGPTRHSRRRGRLRRSCRGR